MNALRILLPILLFVSGLECLALDLSVMTFNVRFGSARDRENAWDHRKEILVETIKAANPDIVGTQECLEFQAKYIVEKLPEYDWVGLGRQIDGTGEMTAVIYRKNVFLPVETGHSWLSESPEIPASKSWDSSLPRIVTRVKFYHAPTLTPFAFYNTHFDHKGEIARLESAKLLASRLQKESIPAIVAGDFNALGGASAPWEALTVGDLKDSWDIAESKEGPANTWNGFEVPMSNADRRIDWILVSPGLKVSRCATLDKDYSGRYPSDHFPVLATISLPENAQAAGPEE